MLASTRGRRRTLDRNKKTLLCDAVSRGATMTEAAFTVGVSLRTVQREARIDPDFDQKLRSAHTDKPDPLAMMQSAARTHWRAAAWLLERSNPENYGRRSASSCTPFQFDEAMKVVVEAALRLAPPENRAKVYAHLSAAAETAFKAVFPNYGPFGGRLVERLPDTPLTDAEHLEAIRNPPPHSVVPEGIEASPAAVEAPAPPALQPRALPGGRPPLQEAVAALKETPGQRPGLQTSERQAVVQTDPAENDKLATNRPSPAAAPVPTPKRDSSPTPASRLPWQYILRAARTTPMVPSTPNSASITHPPILSHLSPKTGPATKFKHDEKPPDALPHSATTAKAVE